MKKRLFLVCLCACAAFAGCARAPSAQPTPATAGSADASGVLYVAPDAAGIQTITVTTTKLPEYLDLPAHIEADPTRVVHVYPPAGGRIIEMRVRPWDRVTKGQALAVIESSDLSNAVADYRKATADYDMKSEQLVRSQDLLSHGAIAIKDLQQAKADAQSARAELNAAREQIRVLGMDPDHASTNLNVLAPRSGVVLDVGAAPGEYSNALAAPQPLCTIADLSTVWAVGDIYEKDLTAAKVGESAQVTLNAYPDAHWNGRVSVVGDAVDPNTRTLHVRIVLTNPGTRIKPSMFGTIRLLRSSHNDIVVPSTAVVREGTDAYVFVAETQGHYRRQNVTLGSATDGSVEITAGLKTGDVIVTQGALLLRTNAS
ncbi:MAG TPA: efflux RND transporter periplasmic adaptor subunit [Candidatus Acidoferrum sp.]|nr:efflux RND transporter periplasmic adaptor subunit [Candidatus Acidoferrum sp.]